MKQTKYNDPPNGGKKKAGKAIAITVASVLLAGTLGGGAYLIGSNWDAVKAGINGQVLFTQEEVQKKVDIAYNDGVAQQDVYKAIIEELTSNLALSNNNLSKVTAERDSKQAEITSKTSQIEKLNLEITNLNKTTSEAIAKLNSNIALLEDEKTELQKTIQSNTVRINELNAEISQLENDIKSENAVQTELTVRVNELTGQINKLNGDVEYYQQLLEAYKESSKIITTFKVDDATHAVRVIEPGTCVTDVLDPETTSDVEFLGWAVNGVKVDDLSTYQINSNTTFEAIINRSYNVKFMYESTELLNTKIAKNNYATIENPTNTTHKRFNGWKVNGVKVDLNTYPITAETTFVADIVYSYDVKFVSENVDVLTPQVIESGGFAETVIPEHEYYEFLYWSVDGSTRIDLTTYPITTNTTFIAVWQKEFNTEFYAMGAKTSNVNLISGQPIVFPELELESDCTLIGWTTEIGSRTKQDFTNYIIGKTSSNKYYAIIEKTIAGYTNISIPISTYSVEQSIDVSSKINFNASDFIGGTIYVDMGGKVAQGGSGIFSSGGTQASLNATKNRIIYRGKISLRYEQGKIYYTVVRDSLNTGTWTNINITIDNLTYYI